MSYNDTLTPAAQYGYDEFGRVTSIADSTVTLTYAYDDLDNVTQATTTYANVPTPFILTYTYFPDGHRKSLACATLGPTPYSYTYDLDGKLTGVTFPWGNTCAYTYDEGERLTAKSGSLSVTQYAYNALDRLTTQESRVPGGDVQAGYYNLTYDAAGNLTSIDDNYPLDTAEDLSAHRTFVYDSQDRLTQESILTNGQTTTTNHAYDPADNFTRLRNNLVGSNTGAQQLTGDGTGAGYAYDAEGNTSQGLTGFDTTTSTYDALNRLLHQIPRLPQRFHPVLPSRWTARQPNFRLRYQLSRERSTTSSMARRSCSVTSMCPQAIRLHSGPTIAGVYYVNGWGADGIERDVCSRSTMPPLGCKAAPPFSTWPNHYRRNRRSAGQPRHDRVWQLHLPALAFLRRVRSADV